MKNVFKSDCPKLPVSHMHSFQSCYVSPQNIVPSYFRFFWGKLQTLRSLNGPSLDDARELRWGLCAVKAFPVLCNLPWMEPQHPKAWVLSPCGSTGGQKIGYCWLKYLRELQVFLASLHLQKRTMDKKQK